MKTGEEGHKTFSYAYITLLPRVQRESCYINQIVQFWWFSQLAATKLTSQKSNSTQCVRRGSGQRAMHSFVDFLVLIYLHHVWLGARKCCFKVQVLPCLQVVLGYYTFGLPLSWTAKSFYADPWIELLDKPFKGGRKVHGFRLILAFFEQKVPKTWGRNGSVRIKCHIWTHHTHKLNFFSLYAK